MPEGLLRIACVPGLEAFIVIRFPDVPVHEKLLPMVWVLPDEKVIVLEAFVVKL